MAVYTVHAPPDARPSAAAALRLRVIRDGFSFAALVLPLPWLLWNRLWLATLGYLAVALGLEAVGRFGDERVAGGLALLFALWFALEARGLQRWTLERRGWTLVGVVEGGDLETVERRFLHAWLAPAPGRTPPYEAV